MNDLVILPLSAAQRELWLAQEASGLNFGSVVSELFTIEEGLDENRFRQSVDLAFVDIDSMRIRFMEKDGVLLQQFDPSVALDCPVIDLVHEKSPWTELHKWIARDCERSARMAEAPFCSMPLFRLAGGKYAWCVQAPHMVMDGYTGMLWVQRVAEIYNAILEKRPIPDHQLGRLTDLLNEEKKYRASEQFEQDRAFWMEAMASPGVAATIAERDVPSRGGHRRNTLVFEPDVRAALEGLAQKTGIQLSNLLFAAVAVYLFRVSGIRALTVGLPVTGRVGRLSRATPGTMSNILPLRIDVDADDTVVDIAREIARRVRRMLRHQRYRSEDLRRDLKLTTQDSALYRVHVNYLPFDYGISFGGSAVEVYNLSTGSVEDVSFEFYDRHDGRGVSIQIKFQENLYSPEEISRALRAL